MPSTMTRAHAAPDRAATVRLCAEGDLLFLSDRWGEANDAKGAFADGARPGGLESPAALDGLLREIAPVFAEETAFLVASRQLAIEDAARERAAPGLRIMIEFETADEYAPDEALNPAALAPGGGWRRWLASFAPALVALSQTLDVYGARARGAEVFVSDAGLHVAAYGVLLPVDTRDLFAPLNEAVYRNGLPFPPSAHAAIAALSRLGLEGAA